MLDAINDVLLERQRQKDLFSYAHDDEHACRELSKAAACYLTGDSRAPAEWPVWPWNPGSWQPRTYRENLVRAAALTIAEIDRLDRQVYKPEDGAEVMTPLENAQECSRQFSRANATLSEENAGLKGKVRRLDAELEATQDEVALAGDLSEENAKLKYKVGRTWCNFC